MSTNKTSEVINSYLSALLDRGDFARYFAEDVRWTTMETGDVVEGRSAVRDFITAIHTQVFDARPELRSLFVDNDAAILEAVFIGKHIGEFAGISPTGAEIRVPYSVAYEVKDGMITELRAYVPILAMVKQVQEEADSAAPSPVAV